MPCSCSSGALSPAEAAQYLGGISVGTLANWRSAGTGPRYVLLGRRVVYRVADLDSYLTKHVRGSARKAAS